jgi:m7GpppX diphosphatase
MNVGQAHLLDDIISLLELDGMREPGQSIFERMTLSYTLGHFHGLYDSMAKATEGEEL